MLIKRMIQRGLMLFIFCQFLLPANAQQILTLDKALEIAKLNSPDIQRSLLNLKNNEETLKAQNAALKSDFSLSLTPFSYDKTRRYQEFQSKWYTAKNASSGGTFTIAQPFLPTDATISLVDNFGYQDNYTIQFFPEEGNVKTPNKAFFNSLALRIAQPIFTYNRTQLTLNTLELNLENAQLSYSMQQLNLEKQVLQFFYNVYMAQMSLSISQDEFTNTQKSYEITQNKVSAGIAAKEELYQAELNFATAKSSLNNAQVTLENYKDQFKQYIGMDIMEDITVMTDVALNPITVDVNKAIEHGLNSRMELRQREIDIENSQFQMIRTKSQNEFKGDIVLSMGLGGENENLQDIYQTPTKQPHAEISFNIPLYDWGRKKALIKAQEALIETAELNQTEEKKQITVDIRRVYRSLQNLINQIDIAKQNEKNAQLTYEINLERYANGDLTSMDMNLFQTQLSQKKMAYAQALIDYKIELLNLKIQSLYDFEKNEAIVPDFIIQKK